MSISSIEMDYETLMVLEVHDGYGQLHTKMACCFEKYGFQEDVPSVSQIRRY